jgi:sulfoxide reductase catalytic subunit YedY
MQHGGRAVKAPPGETSGQAPAFRRKRPLSLPERCATPEAVFWNRRRFLRALGLGGAALAGGWLDAGCRGEPPPEALTATPPGAPAADLFPARRNRSFDADTPPVDRPLTAERVAARYNNFYEMSGSKDDVWERARRLTISPWTVRIDGLVEQPWSVDIDELVRAFPLEERVYRFRCVEAWAMVVPWTGFPLRALLERVRPLGSARYVRLESYDRPSESPGRLLHPFLPWPYTEGLTLSEAFSELTFVVTGIYGHPLPKQHGAPLRIVIPWKYGFKGPKSVVRITVTRDRPATFWNSIAPDEYDFQANVDPSKPHPRWSQATERSIDTGERRSTLLYNGYAEWVAHLYRRT